MKLKRILRQFFFKKEKGSWKDQYEIGRGTYGEPIIQHWGEPTTLKMGNFCSIASNVTILLGGNHRIDWITTYPFSILRASAQHMKGHPASRGDVIIGNDVWIGTGAVILSGVRIGNGAVIGASAVVTHDVPPYRIVAGNPAKVVRMRFREEDISILQALAWWHWDDAKIDAAMPFLLNGDVSALQSFSSEYDLSVKQGAAPGADKR